MQFSKALKQKLVNIKTEAFKQETLDFSISLPEK